MALRIPTVLAFTVLGAAVAVAVQSCTDDPGPASCPVVCLPDGSAGSAGSAHCPPTTCATGSNHDMCPADCHPEPIA